VSAYSAIRNSTIQVAHAVFAGVEEALVADRVHDLHADARDLFGRIGTELDAALGRGSSGGGDRRDDRLRDVRRAGGTAEIRRAGPGCDDVADAAFDLGGLRLAAW
jgi:hypothetical protein